MTELIIYASAAFVLGFGIAWFIRSGAIAGLKKQLGGINSMLEQERLIKETQRKENYAIQQHQQAKEIELANNLSKAHAVLKKMDEDILLLQKNNEETERLLQASQPEIHELKLKLIESQNTLARYKAKLSEK